MKIKNENIARNRNATRFLSIFFLKFDPESLSIMYMNSTSEKDRMTSAIAEKRLLAAIILKKKISARKMQIKKTCSLQDFKNSQLITAIPKQYPIQIMIEEYVNNKLGDINK